MKYIKGLPLLVLPVMVVIFGLSFGLSSTREPSQSQVLGLTTAFTLTKPSTLPQGVTYVSSDGLINCGSDCSEVYQPGDVVVLTAQGAAGSYEVGWNVLNVNDPAGNGNCNEGNRNGLTCTVTIFQNGTNVSTYWSHLSYNVILKKIGSGAGTVSGQGVSCGSVCATSLANKANLAITALPAAGSVFAGWQIDNGANQCFGYVGGGKGGEVAVGTSPNCIINGSYLVKDLVAVAKFDIVPSPVKPTLSPTPSIPSVPSVTNSPSTDSKNSTTTTSPDVAVPTVKLKNSSGQEVVSTKENPIEYESGKTIILTGATVPNGVVKLYIYSEPQEATITADTSGSWTYAINSIESGSHRVEVVATNPVSGKTSARAEVAYFQVKNSAVATTIGRSSVDSQDNNRLMLFLAAGGALVAAIIVTLTAISLRKKKQSNMEIISPPNFDQNQTHDAEDLHKSAEEVKQNPKV